MPQLKEGIDFSLLHIKTQVPQLALKASLLTLSCTVLGTLQLLNVLLNKHAVCVHVQDEGHDPLGGSCCLISAQLFESCSCPSDVCVKKNLAMGITATVGIPRKTKQVATKPWLGPLLFDSCPLGWEGRKA